MGQGFSITVLVLLHFPLAFSLHSGFHSNAFGDDPVSWLHFMVPSCEFGDDSVFIIRVILYGTPNACFYASKCAIYKCSFLVF